MNPIAALLPAANIIVDLDVASLDVVTQAWY